MDKGIEELIADMKAAAEKATSGEWWSDVVECDGTYGNGDECAEGFHSYAVYDSNNQTLLDMTNSTASCIQVDCDDESHYAWDEVAERNAEYIVLARPENVLKLIAALEQAQQELIKPLAIGELIHRLENQTGEKWIREVDHNGMMQLSNELAEMKRKQKPAYDVTAFGQFSAWGMGGELRTAITQFIFDGDPANRKGEMVPKFMLQGIINSLQEHCDKMGDESLVEIMVGAGGTVEGSE